MRIPTLLLSLLLISSPAAAGMRDAGEFARTWGLRTVGVFVGLALHEGCHIGAGRAFGAEFSTVPNIDGGPLPGLRFGGLSRRQDRVVAIAGNGCTALASEIIVQTGLHRRSNIAWGLALFHSWNASAYAFSTSGDSVYWESNGGNIWVWRTAHVLHSARIGNILAKDSGFVTTRPRMTGGWDRPHRWEQPRAWDIAF